MIEILGIFYKSGIARITVIEVLISEDPLYIPYVHLTTYVRAKKQVIIQVKTHDVFVTLLLEFSQSLNFSSKKQTF